MARRRNFQLPSRMKERALRATGGRIDRCYSRSRSCWVPHVAPSHRCFALEILAVQWRRRSEEHTSELQSLMRISYAVFCLKKKKTLNNLTKLKSYKQTSTLK